jgi:hypothetical protein
MPTTDFSVETEAAFPMDLRCRVAMRVMVSRYQSQSQADALSADPARLGTSTILQVSVLLEFALIIGILFEHEHVWRHHVLTQALLLGRNESLSQ